jgi:hypothetical protein
MQYQAPRNNTERAIAEIWETLLQIDRVDPLDNFFFLGGSSILAVLMVSQVQNRLHAPITVTDLFSTDTLQEFAEAVSAKSNRGTEYADGGTLVRMPVIGHRRVPRKIALAVLGLIRERDAGEDYPFVIETTLTFDRLLDEQAVAIALEKLISRHRILGACFEVEKNRVYLLDSRRISVTHHETIGDAAELAVLRRHFNHITEIQSDPLARFVHTYHKRSRITVIIEHIASDLHSLATLDTDLRRLIEHPGEQLDKAPDYFDYCRVATTRAGLRRQRESLKFWQGMFPSSLQRRSWLPSASMYPPYTRIARVEALTLEGQNYLNIQELAKRSKTTPFCVLMALFARTIAQLIPGKSFDIESNIEGRTDGNVHDIVGFFMNVSLVRVTPLDLRLDDAAFLHLISTRFLSTVDHAGVSFFEIRKLADASCTLRDYHWPFMFSFQTHSAKQGCNMEDLLYECHIASKNLIGAYMTEGADQYNFTFCYDQSITRGNGWDCVGRSWITRVEAAISAVH